MVHDLLDFLQYDILQKLLNLYLRKEVLLSSKGLFTADNETWLIEFSSVRHAKKGIMKLLLKNKLINLTIIETIVDSREWTMSS